jgi:hypothetical protein
MPLLMKRFPKMSNYYCHPGRAVGTPYLLEMQSPHAKNTNESDCNQINCDDGVE